MDKIIVNCETGLEELVPLTQEEIQQRETEQQNQPIPQLSEIEILKQNQLTLTDTIFYLLEKIETLGGIN